MGHRAALGLGVHDDPMPERQRDGGVVAVTHRAAGIDARVAAHHLPTPAGRVWMASQDRVILVRRHAVRMAIANVNRLATAAEEFFHEMRLARPTTERFVAEEELFIHHQRRFGTKNHSP